MAKNLKTVPLKNYFVALLLLIVIVWGTWYAFESYKLNKEEKLKSSYLVNTGTVTNVVTSFDEIESVFSETPDNYFVFVTYLGEEEEYNLEKDLNSIIKDYKLDNSFYYIDVTKIKNSENYLDKLNELLGLNNYKITEVPTIIYVEENMNDDNILKSEGNEIITASEFSDMLKLKGIKK